MPQGDPKPGEKYLHFENQTYEVTDIARHQETMESYVVYRQLSGEHETWVLPYEMFIGEVDREGDPESSQRFRFQYLGASEEEESKPSDSVWLDRILDAKTSEERYNAVCSIRGEISDRLINNIATVLDLSIPGETTDERYRQLKECMRTIRRYESDRLR